MLGNICGAIKDTQLHLRSDRTGLLTILSPRMEPCVLTWRMKATFGEEPAQRTHWFWVTDVNVCSYLFTGLLQSHKSELRLNLLKRKSEQFLYLAKRCINNTVVCYVNFWIFICTCNVLFFCSKEPLTDSPVSILSPTVLPPDKKGAPPHHQVRGKAPFTKSAKFALTKRLAATMAFSRVAAVRCSLSEQWKVRKQTTPSIHTNTEIKCTVYVPKCHTATWWQSG